MAYEGYAYWRDWQDYIGTRDENGFARFVDSGAIIIDNPDYDLEKAVGLFDRAGIDYERWDLDALTARLPIFDRGAFWPPKRPDEDAFWDESEKDIAGALFMPQSGFVPDPQLATHNLMRAAENRGAEFLFRREVTEIFQSGGRVKGVKLGDGERIEGPVVVNAAGTYSSALNRMAGVDEGMAVKTRSLRVEVHCVSAPEGFDFEEHGCYVFDGDTGVYFRPEVGNTILVGSEDPECDPRQWIDDPADYDREITEAQWRAQVFRLAKRIPSLPIPARPSGLVSLYDVSDDWIPIYDKSDLPGFYMAIGTSGNQFKNAGVAGNLMAELIEACEGGQDHDREPVCVSGRYTGCRLDAGFFSRRRELHHESSFSVNG